MFKKPFISPTVENRFQGFKDWPTSREHLYTYGFNRSTMTDMKGYDVFGFNAVGVDRLGCRPADYENPDVMKFVAAVVGKSPPHNSPLCAENLRGGISLSLPKLLEVRNVVDDICRDNFGFIPDWNTMNTTVNSTVETAAYVAPLGEIRFYVEWGNDGQRKSIDLSSSVIAKVEGVNRGEYFFEFDLKDRSTMQSIAHAHMAASHPLEAKILITRLLERNHIDSTSFSFGIDESSGDAILVAIPTAMASSVDLDLLNLTIDAENAVEALMKLASSAKSSLVRDAANNGILALSGNPSNTSSTFSPR